MNELALFAGGGGSVLAGSLLGWSTKCAVEIDSGARSIMLDRQRDGVIGRFPIWDDVTTFDGRPWRGKINWITGGFPCQDISQAGAGAGITGSRSGLWVEMARIIREVEPEDGIILENSPMLLTRGIDVVLRDLAGMGLHARWGVFRASNAGACHQRSRIYMVAYTDSAKLESLDFQKPIIFDPEESRRRQFTRAIDAALPADDYSSMPRDPDVLARGMDGLKATGNGWVPIMAARAIKTLVSMKI